jgi:UDP-galactopyranose mutase
MRDYLIVGSGLYGMVMARELTDLGYDVTVIDKRSHPGGNIYCDKIEGINVHKYGAHIFHTSDQKVWSYVNRFCEFNNFINSPVAIYKDEIYSLPFNMWTFSKLWNTPSPQKVKEIIREQSREIKNPKNLEEQAISMVGRDIYEKLIKGYTKKQWGRDPKNLPKSIINRLPVRLTFNNNSFRDKYQGIPIGGYNSLISGLLRNIDVKLNKDFFKNRMDYEESYRMIIYTGKIDEFFNYEFGPLNYRSLRFETEVLPIDNYQGNAVVNYTHEKIPWTRILEHKHFEGTKSDKTVITREYSTEYDGKNEAYYPIGDESNKLLYQKYKSKAELLTQFHFGGRLAEYKYYDMHQVIARALSKIKSVAL